MFEADKFILSKGGIFVGLGYLCNSMFKVSIFNALKDTLFVVNDNYSLWHNRLGHVNYKDDYMVVFHV